MEYVITNDDIYRRPTCKFKDESNLLWQLFPRDLVDVEKSIEKINLILNQESCEEVIYYDVIKYELNSKNLIAIDLIQNTNRREYKIKEILHILLEWKSALEEWEKGSNNTV